ncbi:ABC transporter ATP-binding protein [Gracilibacillus xinjiangensis]|uniref:ABC transporter ATP-binding protein n=1 Tax=Gracilibacillus xinjiangensis TaxID=1193282 RepID=A0ABV8WXH4_9BACI
MDQVEVSIEGLKVKFPDEKSFLFKDFSLSINKGEKVLLVGPSGAGKSTLLKILAGIIPHSVEIPMKCADSKLSKHSGYVFQDPDTQFCMPYVDEEIAFVLENLQIPHEEMSDRIQFYMEKVGLVLPESHTKIDKLSGGMKQRLAIASTLALQPDVMFLDEPTAMLDSEGTQQVWESVRKIASDKTVIIVEHKIEHVYDFADRMIMLDSQGAIVADGEPNYVINHYKDLFRQYGIWYPGVWEENIPSYLQYAEKPVPEMTIHHLTGYRSKKGLIHVENAIVNKGEWITITGKNGSGKSTLLQALAKLIKTKGEINYSIKQDKAFYRYVGFVFQNPELQFVTNTVYEELAFSLRDCQLTNEACEQRIRDQLAVFQLEHVKNKHPFQLSVGQMKRLSIATVTIMRPKILLLDEPTFGQDAANTFRMLDYFLTLSNDGTTILMVTHDLHIRNYFATTEWIIDAGKLAGVYRLRNTEGMEGKQSAIGT